MKKIQFLSRDNLKWIAVITMILDHIGGVFFTVNSCTEIVLRDIFGRISYPLFCLLFVESFFYSKHKARHIRDLFIFGLLSEPAFDMVTNGTWFNLSYQNIMFTWLLGWVLMIIMEKILKNNTYTPLIKASFIFCIFFIFVNIAFYTNVDYSACGIICVTLGYLIKYFKPNIPGYILIIPIAIIDALVGFEYGALISILVCLFYNDKKKNNKLKNNKYLFYVIYPLHLLILAFARALLMG